MTDKLDAAVIRELLAVCERAKSVEHYGDMFSGRTSVAFREFQKQFTPTYCATLARYALELSDKAQSQAAELERLRRMVAEGITEADIAETRFPTQFPE